MCYPITKAAMQYMREKMRDTLRSGERIFKLDIPYLMKGGLWTTLSFIVGTLGSLVTMVAFGNLLPRETYGIYSYLLSLGATLSFLTLSGTSTGVMRAVARGYESVIPEALRMTLKFNTLAILTILSAAFYYGYRDNWLFAISLALLALAYPVTEAFHIYKSILTGQKRFDTMAKITAAITFVGAMATVLTLSLTDDILILITLYTVMALVPSIIVYRKIVQKVDQKEPEAEQVRELKRTSFHLTGAGIIGIIASYVDKIVLFQVAGPAVLAAYSFATAGPERLKSLIKNWIGIALPTLAQRSLLQIRQTLYLRIGLCLLFGLIIGAVYFSLVPLLFKLFLPLYLDSIKYTQGLALSLVAVPVTIYIGSIFASQNMLKATYILNLGSQIIRILLFVSFGWLWQIWGLVFATVLSSFLNAVYSLVVWEIEIRRLSKKT